MIFDIKKLNFSWRIRATIGVVLHLSPENAHQDFIK